MSEPSPTLSREPFSPAPTQPAAASGCGTPALIGCGILILLLGAAAVIFLLKAKDLFRWSLARMESEVMSQLPEEVSDEEAARLRRAFDGAVAAVVEGRAQPADLQSLQGRLLEVTRKPAEELTRADVLELTAALEQVAAGGGEASPGAAPEGTPRPQARREQPPPAGFQPWIASS